MRCPESWKERVSFLELLESNWHPVPRAALILACAFYAWFLWDAASGNGALLMINLVFVPIHEGGHLLFGYLGEFLGVAGGTLFQLGVPFALAVYFVFDRRVQGTAFCGFFFFEQLLPISKYMADARAQELPLLTVGDANYAIHDWGYLFGKLGLLSHDVPIAHAVRVVGWTGMLGTVAWMIWRSRPRKKAEAAQ